MTNCELPDGLYVARDGNLWKMDTKYIPPKDTKVVWIGGKPTEEDAVERLESELRDCRNELCLRCGTYREKHLGACDGCRWKDGDW